MLSVLAIMALGITLGYLIRKRKTLVSLNNKLVMWAIYLLLFLLGMSIGTNQIILKNLPTLGITALLISCSTILGSVLVAWLGYLLWFKPKKNRE